MPTLKSAFRSHLLHRPPRHAPEQETVQQLADPHSSAKVPAMAAPPNLRAMVDALDEPSLIVQGNYVQLANRAAQKILGVGIEGRDVRLAIRHPQALDQILGHRSADVDITGIGELGRSWRLAIRHLGPNSVLIRMIDRSESVSAEKMRVDFVANASHELRTPLSTVLGYAETLAEDDDLPSATRSSFGRTISDEARRMLRIIEDLMSLSRIEADRFVAPNETIPIAEVIQTAVANAGKARCEFVVDLAADLNPVRGDRSQLIQVFDNLLGNAIRYGCEGTEPRVEITGKSDGRWIVITVTDHGAGIPREHLSRVTERFYRVDAARSRESGGTGLGLAIVKHIVERHRGSLEIRSTVGIGTSVVLRLPAAV